LLLYFNSQRLRKIAFLLLHVRCLLGSSTFTQVRAQRHWAPGILGASLALCKCDLCAQGCATLARAQGERMASKGDMLDDAQGQHVGEGTRARAQCNREPNH
jgi:hypothetical protein